MNVEEAAFCKGLSLKAWGFGLRPFFEEGATRGLLPSLEPQGVGFGRLGFRLQALGEGGGRV